MQEPGRRRRIATGVAAVTAIIFVVAATLALVAFATRPAVASGCLSASAPAFAYTSGPFALANRTAQTAVMPRCGPGALCADHAIVLAVPRGYQGLHSLQVQVAWPDPTAEFDVYLLDAHHAVVAHAANGTDPQVLVAPAVRGDYTVRIVPLTPLHQRVTTTVSLVGTPPSAAPAPGVPRYQHYAAPGGLATLTSNPSIGAD